MLKLEAVHSYYGKIHALKGISLEIRKQSISCLIGANGAGKSTTLMAISGIQPISSGKIGFQGMPIHNRAPDEIVRYGIIQVPEGRRIFPNLTVHENLLLGAYLSRDKERVNESIQWVFTLFPVLAERRRQLGGTLSGGEQQMLAIARGLMGNPRLLLLDEPSLGLAPLLVEHIMSIIREICQWGVTILLVEQNARAALALSDSAYVLEGGRVVLEGESRRLLQDPRVKEAYLGE